MCCGRGCVQELSHGGAQEAWVQSQTTFATLAHGEVEGEWEARVLKQKIWVDGISYELQVPSLFHFCLRTTLHNHLIFDPT